MVISNGDIITIGNNKYLIVESARYEDVDYILVNKLNENEEITKDYNLMKKNKDGVIMVTDKKILDIVLPVFSNKLQKDAEKYNEQNKFEIGDNK